MRWGLWAATAAVLCCAAPSEARVHYRHDVAAGQPWGAWGWRDYTPQRRYYRPVKRVKHVKKTHRKPVHAVSRRAVPKVATVEKYAAWKRPGRFVRGALRCAANVNAALAERGIRGTGSLMARSFLSWGRPSAPVPGAVVVFARGSDRKSGHVAIVAKVTGRTVYLWNPSRGGWRMVRMYRRPLAYRVA